MPSAGIGNLIKDHVKIPLFFQYIVILDKICLKVNNLTCFNLNMDLLFFFQIAILMPGFDFLPACANEQLTGQ